jgi:hypothetical protein
MDGPTADQRLQVVERSCPNCGHVPQFGAEKVPDGLFQQPAKAFGAAAEAVAIRLPSLWERLSGPHAVANKE